MSIHISGKIFPPPDGDVDPGVEEADGREGDEAEHQQPRPVDVPRDVHLVHPGGEQVRRHNVVSQMLYKVSVEWNLNLLYLLLCNILVGNRSWNTFVLSKIRM